MDLTFTYQPVAPFRLDLTAWVLRRNADNAIDRWDGQAYRRVLALDDAPIEVTVVQTGPPEAPDLQIHVAGNASKGQAQAFVTDSLQRLLGLQIDLTAFYQFADSLPRLKPLVQRFRGFKPPRFQTLFEALVNAIACQQITLTQGIHLLDRLAENFGPSFQGADGTGYGFPRPQDLARLAPETLRSLSFSRQKSAYLIGLASDVTAKRLDLQMLESLDDGQAIAFLRQIHGVGRWTAEYVLLRGLGRLNIFPGDDVGARNHLKSWLGLPELGTYQQVMQALEPWIPYTGLIYFHLLLKRLAEEGCIKA